jgi:hypothetical protein
MFACRRAHEDRWVIDWVTGFAPESSPWEAPGTATCGQARTRCPSRVQCLRHRPLAADGGLTGDQQHGSALLRGRFHRKLLERLNWRTSW